MTDKSRACDSSVFDGNTILVGGDHNENMPAELSVCYADIIISGFEFINFSTQDKFIDFIFLMGNNMIASAIAVGEK